MNRYEAAEKIALAIYHHGWGSLSDSEADVMNYDDEFSATVHTLLQKYRRARLLQTDDKKVRVVDPFQGLLALASVQWEFGDVAREAQLWGHAATDRIVLEIKEWPVEVFHDAVNMGAHLLVFQETLKGNHSEILTSCKSILAKYSCPADEQSTFAKEARSSLARK